MPPPQQQPRPLRPAALPQTAPSRSIVPPSTVLPQKAEADIRNEFVAPSFRRSLPEGWGEHEPPNLQRKSPAHRGAFCLGPEEYFSNFRRPSPSLHSQRRQLGARRSRLRRLRMTLDQRTQFVLAFL